MNDLPDIEKKRPATKLKQAAGQIAPSLTEIDIELKLKGTLAENLIREAKKRQCDPAVLLADMVEIMLNDKLFAAILD